MTDDDDFERMKENLIRLMEEKDFNMKSLSLAAGHGETYVSDLLNRKNRKGANYRKLEPIAKQLGVTVEVLFGGEGVRAQTIPIIGTMSVAEGWDASPNSLISIEFTLEGGEPVAVEVIGDGMSPVYRDGDVLIGTKAAGMRADNLIGLDCIVLTQDGQRYVKILARGPARGRFNLRSYNAHQKDVENVKLQWAAPIRWVKRSQR